MSWVIRVLALCGGNRRVGIESFEEQYSLLKMDILNERWENIKKKWTVAYPASLAKVLIIRDGPKCSK